jgi:anti-anti-sigma factor
MPADQPAGRTSLTVTIERAGAGARIAATGEVDASTAQLLRDTLGAALADGVSTVVLDLAGVRYLDSAGVGALVQAHNSTTARGARLTVANPQPMVRRVLEVVGVLALLTGGSA